MVVGLPKDLIGRELQEDFGVDAHLEGGDGDFLPARKSGLKADEVGLQNSHGESTDSVVRVNAAAVGIGNCHARRAVGDFGHDSVEKEPRVTWMKKSRSFAMQNGVVTSLVVDEVVDFGKSIIGAILYLVSPDGGN